MERQSYYIAENANTHQKSYAFKHCKILIILSSFFLLFTIRNCGNSPVNPLLCQPMTHKPPPCQTYKSDQNQSQLVECIYIIELQRKELSKQIVEHSSSSETGRWGQDPTFPSIWHDAHKMDHSLPKD